MAVEPALAKLRSFLVQIDEDPNIDLDGPIKRLRQVRTHNCGVCSCCSRVVRQSNALIHLLVCACVCERVLLGSCMCMQG